MVILPGATLTNNARLGLGSQGRRRADTVEMWIVAMVNKLAFCSLHPRISILKLYELYASSKESAFFGRYSLL